MVEILAPLPTRPPTPPRPGSRIHEDRPVSPVAAQTPGDSPHLADSSRAPPSTRGSKRVTFSPWLHTTILSPTFAKKSKEPQSKELPNTRSPHQTDNRPFKSILKETSSPIPVWSPNVDTFTTESLAMLLESVIQQLAGESITSRLDAYMQFFGALRTYDGLPAGKDIAEKLGLVTEFIQRDVSRDLVNGAPLDTNLANQALKLSAAFVWHADVSTQLSEEFKVFLLEHAITCLHEAKVPKSVLTHYMSILSTQNFGPRVMTNARVVRILTVLQDVSKHISGKAIALHRLNIYQRLLTQSKPSFLSHSSLWIEHLIFGLLHHMKDTRYKAIALGFQISVAAGPNAALSKNIRDLFDRPLENERKLINEIRERMSRMMGSVDSGIHVPQIWSVIILLLRSRKWNLEQWEHFKEWVLVLQKCFNCSEPAIKAQAIVGWNRFVYAVSPNETTGRSLLKMLGKPVLSQFERKKSDKSGSPPTQLALNSYYNLLYYAFRPSLAHHYLDLIWEEYVLLPSASIFSAVPALSDSACRVLANLLWCQQAKVWTESRINDSHKIEAEELPSIDPRWLRSRISPVLKVFESLFKASVWDDNALEKSNVALAWKNLASALYLASSKEITPSGESMQAVASVLGLLHRVWAAGPSSLNAVGEDCTDNFFQRFRFLSTTIMLVLGGIPFTEKLLLKTADETFQTANTPTHRTAVPGTNLDSPILHLLRIISSTFAILEPTPSYIRLVDEMIEVSCRSKLSRGSRLELLQQCATLSTTEPTSQSHPPSRSGVFWKTSAQAAADALQSFPIESARERDGSVSRDYENIIKILAAGLQFPSMAQQWSHLLETFVRVARTEKGDQVLATLIVEPIAGFLMGIPVRDTYLPTTSLLAHSLSIPFMRETGLGIEGLPSFPRTLLESIGRTLTMAYNDFSASEAHGLSDFLESLTSFLGCGVPPFRAQVLEALETPLSLWIKDQECKVDVTRSVESRILTACRALSSAILNVLQTSVVDELRSLQKFETIICAGLESPHMSRTKRFVDFWYSTRSSSESSAARTAMAQAALQAGSRLSAAADNETQNVAGSLSSAQETAEKAKGQRLRTSLNRPATNLTSSPVIGANQVSTIDTGDLTEPQLPTLNHRPLTEDQVNNEVSIAQYPNNRREVFQMIEAIRSSSPANTPGKLGYDTPVHLRKLRASQGTTDIPLTPTLAPTENEEGYIGSSPTPATRDPTPAVNSDAPLLNAQDLAMTDATDLPSSPPELDSRSPSPQKRARRSRSERRRSARARKAMRRRSLEVQSATNSPANADLSRESKTDLSETDAVRAEPNENSDVPQVDERPPSRRLRSALSLSTENEQNLVPAPSFGTPTKPSNPMLVEPNTRSKSALKKKKRKSSLKTANTDGEQAVSQDESQTAPPAPDDFVYSSSEDVETQIASQLEQDLEFAMDMNGSMHEQPLQQQDSAVSSKKRKREEEEKEDVRPSTSKERRRSTRLSSTKDVAVINLENHDARQSQDSGAASQNASLAKATSPTLRRSTRGSQRKEDEPTPVVVSPPSRVQICESTQESIQDEAGSRPPAKRPRNSPRRAEQSEAATEETSSQVKPTRNRSRKTRSSRNETESQSQSSQEQVTQVDAAPAEFDLFEGQAAEQDVVLESNVQAKTAEPAMEECDSQMTDMAPSTTASDPATTNKRMDMDVDQIPDQQPSTAEVQTDPIPPHPEPDNTSEIGITKSLKKILDAMRLATLGPQALREVDDLLFNIRVEAHDASRRHNSA